MKGDFSRITFDAANHFSRVLTQQGRVTLDADSNEQAAILLHYVRTLARDLIGPYGGPADALGFKLDVVPASGAAPKPTLNIGPGRYYVDGILCENDADCAYDAQPDHTPGSDDPLLLELSQPTHTKPFWLYLDVWERHITPIEDDRMREVALGGPDTCTRAKVVWQVKALPLTNNSPSATGTETGTEDCTAPLAGLTAIGAARMAAELDPGQQIKDPCVVDPDARYRGVENQLYRVEVHRGSGPDNSVTPTFKWSRDNGSVASAWLGTDGNDLVVASARGFSAGAWVELSDDRLELRGEPGVLVKLSSVDGNRLSVDPSSVPPSASLAWTAALETPKVRRWDQTQNDDITLDGGAVQIVESTGSEPPWIDLEDGLRVRFEPTAGNKQQYRSGDYWLIPARVATGDIEWPRHDEAADFLPPHGIEHHYAPLGGLRWNASKQEFSLQSCVCTLQEINSCKRTVRPQLVPARRLATGRPAAPQPAPAPGRSPTSGPRNPGSKPK